jgi:DNA-binding NtrC family response regulator
MEDGDEREVFRYLETMTLEDVLSGPRRVPPAVLKYCTENPGRKLGEILPLSLEQFVTESSAAKPLKEQVNAFEKVVIHNALRLCGGSRKATARMLGVSRVTLWSRMSRWNWLK